MGIVAHEIMHALAFWHEQQRYDRDTYITLNVSNIIESYLYLNFMKLGPDEISTFNLPYEYGSNMHYGTESFTIDTSIPGMFPVDPNYQYTIGGTWFPSFLDIYKINILYNFTSTMLTVTCITNTLNFPNEPSIC